MGETKHRAVEMAQQLSSLREKPRNSCSFAIARAFAGVAADGG